MSAHTPGPWVAAFTGPHVETRHGFWKIAPVDASGRPDWDREVAATADDNEANARLIAAAPDLLEALRSLFALEAVRGLWDDGPEGEGWPSRALSQAIAAGDAALAKADGR
jgi:hypothetical protein